MKDAGPPRLARMGSKAKKPSTYQHQAPIPWHIDLGRFSIVAPIAGQRQGNFLSQRNNK
jgi:hypothetical protein